MKTARKWHDLSGIGFGRLTAQWPVGINWRGRVLWLCVCECGQLAIINSNQLKSGRTKSCGCLRQEWRNLRGGKKLHHGHAAGGKLTREYITWSAMWSRCTNPNTPPFMNYGGRGITVCDRWRDFNNFLADMGLKPAGMSIERVNNDGNYEPTNCRWATPLEQNRNKRHRKGTALCQSPLA